LIGFCYWKFKKISNSENVKNKECVHTWANVTGYTSYNEIEPWPGIIQAKLLIVASREIWPSRHFTLDLKLHSWLRGFNALIVIPPLI
jgi:hypothetical protein